MKIYHYVHYYSNKKCLTRNVAIVEDNFLKKYLYDIGVTKRRRQPIKFLYGFVDVFYRDTTISERAKSEALSTILTPSDEAFILL